MKNIKTYLQLTLATAFFTLATACSDDDDEPQTKVPPQSYEEQSVSVMLSLDLLSRAAGTTSTTSGVKTSWEEGDKAYFSYTKTFASDEEILNTFTLSQIDALDNGKAIFTCNDFVVPRGIEEGKLVYVGKQEVNSVSDLLPESISLDNQVQKGNNDLSNIGNYLHMETSFAKADTTKELTVMRMKHTFSLVTLQIKRPESFEGNLKEVTFSLESNNVTLLGTADNSITLTLENAEWQNDRLWAHIVVCMSGLINEGNTWTIGLKDEADKQVNVTFPAKTLEESKHYSSFISDNPADYEVPVEIEIPGFEDAGDAFDD